MLLPADSFLHHLGSPVAVSLPCFRATNTWFPDSDPLQALGHCRFHALISKPDVSLLTSAGGLLHHLGNPLGVSLPHSLTLSDTHLDTRGYRSSASAQVSANQLSHISTAQLLPNAFPSLYASNPGAMLGSGQAAHQALGSQNHSSLNANLNATSAQTQRYLAGLGMGQVNIAAVFVYLWCNLSVPRTKHGLTVLLPMFPQGNCL